MDRIFLPREESRVIKYTDFRKTGLEPTGEQGLPTPVRVAQVHEFIKKYSVKKKQGGSM